VGLGLVVKDPAIEVVLPTFNGAPYLEQQVASIDAQTLRPLRLLVRDDGSSDGTLQLLDRLQERYGSWLVRLPTERNLGCSANVNRLLEATTAPYVALADQDDVWLPQKLERSWAVLQQREARLGVDLPLLVHSDLNLIDAQGQSLGCTYLQRQRLNPRRTDPVDLALTNVVTGCTAFMNRRLLEYALPIPGNALMHDWWLALVASLLGDISFLPEATVLYRQHARNVLGASGLGLDYWLRRLQAVVADPAAGGHTRAAVQQLLILEQRTGRVVSALPELLQEPRRRRWWRLLRMPARERPWKHGVWRTIGLYGLLVCMPRLTTKPVYL
jgi:glycosyltransferase involved in cell wall biosynthesis